LQKYEHLQDWHPGSNNQVLNLVHPSLYCYSDKHSVEINPPNYSAIETIENWNKFIEIGRDRDVGGKNYQGAKVVSPRKYDSDYAFSENYQCLKGPSNDYAFSENYQWLPCDIQVNDDYSAKIISYINNIHPFVDSQLYEIIEKIFPYFLPMFEKVLTDYAYPSEPRVNISRDWYTDDPVINSDNEDEEEEILDNWYNTRVPDVPINIGEFVKPNPKPYISLKNRKLQVIVKAANIILTPDNPTYSGGVWHIEGMENESIVATGIYYYQNEYNHFHNIHD
jgi:hypothetical protein